METAAGTIPEATSKPPANPHVLWRQLLGLVLWILVPVSLVEGPIAAVFALALGGATFADAWLSGIYKDPSSSSFVNISPMGWGIAMALLLVVAYPLYLIKRNKLRTRDASNGFYVATIALGAVVIALLAFSIVAG